MTQERTASLDANVLFGRKTIFSPAILTTRSALEKGYTGTVGDLGAGNTQVIAR